MADPDEKRAWEYLQELDRRQYKSYTKAVVLAVNAYFGRLEQLEDDPYLETRQKEDAFLKRITEAIKEGAREAMPMATCEALARLFQMGTAPTATILDQGKEHQNVAANSNAATQEDADIALDFADGF